MRRTGLALLLVCLATVLGSCGSKDLLPANRISGSRLTIYASVPLRGPSAVSGRAVVNGARLALAQVRGRIGRYQIVFRALDDSAPGHPQWDPGQTTDNARRAVADQTTIAYLGDFNSGASAVSVPLLNRAGIPQVSPTSTAVGLTSSGPGASPGEPQKYYPTGIRTFARVIPNDAVQAAVQIKLQRRAGCRSIYVVDDGEVDGEAMAATFQLAARSAGLTVLGVQSFQPGAADYRSFVDSVAGTHPDCVLIGAITGSGAVAVTRQLAASLPQAKLFASNGLAESTYTAPAQGGIPFHLDSRLVVTIGSGGLRDAAVGRARAVGAGRGLPAIIRDAVPSGLRGATPAARAFYVAYALRFGRPQPSAIYGYEAMTVLLGAIATATHDGRGSALRTQVLAAIFDGQVRDSVLGVYRIQRDGDVTLRRYGAWRVRDGRLEFWKTVGG